MNETIGIDSTSLSIPNIGLNESPKCLTNSNDSNTVGINKRLKSKSSTSTTSNGTRSLKRHHKKQKSINLKRKRLIHSDTNNNNKSTKKLKSALHSNLNYITINKKETQIHQISKNNNYCNFCGDCFGDMISCTICSAPFHIECINLSLSKDDISKDSYICGSCQTTKTARKIIRPFSFTPKKHLHGQNFKKNQSYQPKLGQANLLTASNGQPLIQPSGEIKFRPKSTNNEKHKHILLSSSNLKRKRIDSSTSSINNPITDLIKNPNDHLDTLHRLIVLSQTEEFHGPSSSNDSTLNENQKFCFTCRKSTSKQGPSIRCDYCPLTYHLDCLASSVTSLPSLNEKWICPNHIEPIIDRYLTSKTTCLTSERVRIYHQSPQIEQNIIIQEFSNIKQTKDYFLANTINNHRFECVNTSQIPKTIQDFYQNTNIKQKNTSDIELNDTKEEKPMETSLLSSQPSDAYDPCIWDILQAILNHIVNHHSYEFSLTDSALTENVHRAQSSSLENKCNTLNTIDTLLQALNEPDRISEPSINNSNLPIALNQKDSLEQKQIPTPLINTLSHLINLSEFYLSRAALIHLNSKTVIYIRKYVIWFGSSPLNDICLNNFPKSSPCRYITEKHACLYYDRKNNLFELLNYSEYGTIVNGLRYGIGILNDDDDDKQKNENLLACSCLTESYHRSSWDGPAQIEQGTVIKIGCHEFLFYRHIVR